MGFQAMMKAIHAGLGDMTIVPDSYQRMLRAQKERIGGFIFANRGNVLAGLHHPDAAHKHIASQADSKWRMLRPTLKSIQQTKKRGIYGSYTENQAETFWVGVIMGNLQCKDIRKHFENWETDKACGKDLISCFGQNDYRKFADDQCNQKKSTYQPKAAAIRNLNVVTA